MDYNISKLTEGLVKTKVDSELEALSEFLNKMGIAFEIVEEDNLKKKQIFLNELEKGVKEVNTDIRGEIKLKTLDELINELQNINEIELNERLKNIENL